MSTASSFPISPRKRSEGLYTPAGGGGGKNKSMFSFTNYLFPSKTGNPPNPIPTHSVGSDVTSSAAGVSGTAPPASSSVVVGGAGTDQTKEVRLCLQSQPSIPPAHARATALTANNISKGESDLTLDPPRAARQRHHASSQNNDTNYNRHVASNIKMEESKRKIPKKKGLRADKILLLNALNTPASSLSPPLSDNNYDDTEGANENVSSEEGGEEWDRSDDGGGSSSSSSSTSSSSFSLSLWTELSEGTRGISNGEGAKKDNRHVGGEKKPSNIPTTKRDANRKVKIAPINNEAVATPQQNTNDSDDKSYTPLRSVLSFSTAAATSKKGKEAKEMDSSDAGNGSSLFYIQPAPPLPPASVNALQSPLLSSSLLAAPPQPQQRSYERQTESSSAKVLFPSLLPTTTMNVADGAFSSVIMSSSPHQEGGLDGVVMGSGVAADSGGNGLHPSHQLASANGSGGAAKYNSSSKGAASAAILVPASVRWAKVFNAKGETLLEQVREAYPSYTPFMVDTIVYRIEEDLTREELAAKQAYIDERNRRFEMKVARMQSQLQVPYVKNSDGSAQSMWRSRVWLVDNAPEALAKARQTLSKALDLDVHRRIGHSDAIASTREEQINERIAVESQKPMVVRKVKDERDLRRGHLLSTFRSNATANLSVIEEKRRDAIARKLQEAEEVSNRVVANKDHQIAERRERAAGDENKRAEHFEAALSLWEVEEESKLTCVATRMFEKMVARSRGEALRAWEKEKERMRRVEQMLIIADAKEKEREEREKADDFAEQLREWRHAPSTTTTIASSMPSSPKAKRHSLLKATTNTKSTKITSTQKRANVAPPPSPRRQERDLNEASGLSISEWLDDDDAVDNNEAKWKRKYTRRQQQKSDGEAGGGGGSSRTLRRVEFASSSGIDYYGGSLPSSSDGAVGGVGFVMRPSYLRLVAMLNASECIARGRLVHSALSFLASLRKEYLYGLTALANKASVGHEWRIKNVNRSVAFKRRHEKRAEEAIKAAQETITKQKMSVAEARDRLNSTYKHKSEAVASTTEESQRRTHAARIRREQREQWLLELSRLSHFSPSSTLFSSSPPRTALSPTTTTPRKGGDGQAAALSDPASSHARDTKNTRAREKIKEEEEDVFHRLAYGGSKAELRSIRRRLGQDLFETNYHHLLLLNDDDGVSAHAQEHGSAPKGGGIDESRTRNTSYKGEERSLTRTFVLSPTKRGTKNGGPNPPPPPLQYSGQSPRSFSPASAPSPPSHLNGWKCSGYSHISGGDGCFSNATTSAVGPAQRRDAGGDDDDEEAAQRRRQAIEEGAIVMSGMSSKIADMLKKVTGFEGIEKQQREAYKAKSSHLEEVSTKNRRMEPKRREVYARRTIQREAEWSELNKRVTAKRDAPLPDVSYSQMHQISAQMIAKAKEEKYLGEKHNEVMKSGSPVRSGRNEEEECNIFVSQESEQQQRMSAPKPPQGRNLPPSRRQANNTSNGDTNEEKEKATPTKYVFPAEAGRGRPVVDRRARVEDMTNKNNVSANEGDESRGVGAEGGHEGSTTALVWVPKFNSNTLPQPITYVAGSNTNVLPTPYQRVGVGLGGTAEMSPLGLVSSGAAVIGGSISHFIPSPPLPSSSLSPLANQRKVPTGTRASTATNGSVAPPPSTSSSSLFRPQPPVNHTNSDGPRRKSTLISTGSSSNKSANKNVAAAGYLTPLSPSPSSSSSTLQAPYVNERNRAAFGSLDNYSTSNYRSPRGGGGGISSNPNDNEASSLLLGAEAKRAVAQEGRVEELSKVVSKMQQHNEHVESRHRQWRAQLREEADTKTFVVSKEKVEAASARRDEALHHRKQIAGVMGAPLSARTYPSSSSFQMEIGGEEDQQQHSAGGGMGTDKPLFLSAKELRIQEGLAKKQEREEAKRARYTLANMGAEGKDPMAFEERSFLSLSNDK